MIYIDFSTESDQRKTWAKQTVSETLEIVNKIIEILDVGDSSQTVGEGDILVLAENDNLSHYENSEALIIKERKDGEQIEGVLYIDNGNTAQLKVVLAGVLTQEDTSDNSTL